MWSGQLILSSSLRLRVTDFVKKLVQEKVFFWKEMERDFTEERRPLPSNVDMQSPLSALPPSLSRLPFSALLQELCLRVNR